MYVMDININYLRNKNKQKAAIHNNAIIFDGIDKFSKAHPKKLQPFFENFSRRLFKHHIWFSRITYPESNFTDCTKIHIPSP